MMNSMQLQNEVLIYTRKPNGDYTESLSNSIHFAYREGNGEFTPLNRNYGILFAEATVNEQNVIQEKGVKNPYLFPCHEGYGILAVRVTSEGKRDEESKGQVLFWTSKDLIQFQLVGLIRLHNNLFVEEVSCNYNQEEEIYEINWLSSEGTSYQNTLPNLSDPTSVSLPIQTKVFNRICEEISFEDIMPGNILPVGDSVGKTFYSHWTPLYNTEIRLPDSVKVTNSEQLREVTATAVYSDGSTAPKRVLWDCKDIDFSTPGNYTVKGKAIQESYPFPLATGYADPVILPWNHKYYYLATNDNVDDIGIFVREADSIKDLFAPGYKESLILDYNEEKGFIQTFWAPEFHVIGEELYILFAVGGKEWAPQCHMMKLKKGGDILLASDWEEPVRVKRADGTYLTEDGITLDMTYFKAGGTSCIVWSYRFGIGTPLDTGSMLYIATIDERNPTVLTSEPVLLSRPLYGWENIQGTINNEGPYPIVTEDTVYITYSGGAACGYTYALGLLSIPIGGDYLNPAAWKKASTPVLSYYSMNGVYGPGHNSFFRDYDGSIRILYHGEKELVPFGTRCSAMHRVHINKAGIPVFDLIEERDLNAELADLTLDVQVVE
ncbi:MAG TPA: family 43 glycosylhydrolase [Lachnospiraceae bacterium]|nr:family 43 glycosylhydrolase [Lachnospiraceae bacterium]